jgi:hypothetical protein
MKITEYLRRAAVCDPGSLCGDIGPFVDAALLTGRFPSDTPLPRDYNAVSRYHADILNGQRIELAAIAQGFDRALWIHASDAALLGLEPRGDPLRLVARKAGTAGFSAHNIYLLDQMSGESLNRLYSYANPACNREQAGGLGEPALRVRNALAVHAVYAVTGYDSGAPDAVSRAKAVQNYRGNTASVSQSGFTRTRETHRSYAAALPPQARAAFEYLRKYHAQQRTALRIIPAGSADNAELQTSFQYLARNPEAALRTVFYSRLFSARLCSPDFAIPYPLSLTPASSLWEKHPNEQPVRRETPIGAFIGR